MRLRPRCWPRSACSPGASSAPCCSTLVVDAVQVTAHRPCRVPAADRVVPWPRVAGDRRAVRARLRRARRGGHAARAERPRPAHAARGRAMSAAAAVDVRELFRVHRTLEGDAAALQGLTLTGGAGRGRSRCSGQAARARARCFGCSRPRAALGRQRAGARRRPRPRWAAAGAPAFRAARSASSTSTTGARCRRGLPARDRRPAAGAARRAARASAPPRRRAARAGRAARTAAGARPGELSGGEQQRVAVCAAVAHRPGAAAGRRAGRRARRRQRPRRLRPDRRAGPRRRRDRAPGQPRPGRGRVADRSVQHPRRPPQRRDRARRASAAIVVGRGGWLRVPEELLRGAGIGERASAEAGDGGVVLRAAGGRAAPRTPRRAAAGARAALATRGRRPVARRLRGVTARGAGARAVLDGLDARSRPAG